MVDVLVDMLLLTETDVLVGKFSSNHDRLVYALMANARRGSVCLPPFVSLDHPWCADWGVRQPIVKIGNTTMGGFLC